MTSIIWTWLQNGKPKGFFKDKNSLLISYDMMPLLGLETMEKKLNEEGRIVCGELVEDASSEFFVPFYQGDPALEIIDWGCHKDSYLDCFTSLSFYLTGPSKEENFHLSEKEEIICREYFSRHLSDDGRRQRPLKRLKLKVLDILMKLELSIKPVTFVEGGDDDCSRMEIYYDYTR